MNIIDFLKDPDLGGRIKSFRNLDSWSAWLVFLKAVFALPLIVAEQQLFHECTGRKVLPSIPVEFVCAIIGRRGGKSIIAAFMATFLAVFKDWRKHLAPGEVGHVIVIAQTLKAARVVFGYIRGIFRAVPTLEKMIVRETTEEIELLTGIIISCWPCTYRSTRGLTVVVAIYDEVDFWSQEGPHMAEEVIASLKPAMLSIPGAMEILISSPYTPLGILHKRFQEDWGKDSDDVLVWKAPSLIMNPTLSEAKIAKAIAADPDRARSEYEAEWRIGVASAFDPVLIDQAVRTDPMVIPPQPSVRYRYAVDTAGLGQSEFTWSVSHWENNRIIIDLINGRGRRWLRGVNLEGTVRACCEEVRRYGALEVMGDRYASEWPPEAFRREGMGYTVAEKSKSDLYLELVPLFLAGKIEIPADSELIRQLKLLQRRTGTQGRDIIEKPKGSHDDRSNVIAVAVAALGVEILHDHLPQAVGTRVAYLGAEQSASVLESWQERTSNQGGRVRARSKYEEGLM